MGDEESKNEFILDIATFYAIFEKTIGHTHEPFGHLFRFYGDIISNGSSKTACTSKLKLDGRGDGRNYRYLLSYVNNKGLVKQLDQF